MLVGIFINAQKQILKKINLQRYYMKYKYTTPIYNIYYIRSLYTINYLFSKFGYFVSKKFKLSFIIFPLMFNFKFMIIFVWLIKFFNVLYEKYWYYYLLPICTKLYLRYLTKTLELFIFCISICETSKMTHKYEHIYEILEVCLMNQKFITGVNKSLRYKIFIQ